MVVHSENPKPGRNGKSNGDVWFFVWLEKVVSEAIWSTTRPETEHGPRSIEEGLGDQESAVSRGRRLVKKSSIWSSKRGLLALSERATFSVFVRSDNENVIGNRNRKDETKSLEDVDVYSPTSSIDHSQVQFKSLI